MIGAARPPKTDPFRGRDEEMKKKLRLTAMASCAG
jgi:hypothetical protein